MPSKVGIVAVPDGTTYTLNNTNIRLEDLHGYDTDMRVGLLFDNVINDVFDRQAELEKQADLRMPALKPGAVRHFQSQYLDLVDMNNGNAWVKASKDVEVYWGYRKEPTRIRTLLYGILAVCIVTAQMIRLNPAMTWRIFRR